jgi:hypothetical protein
VNGDVVERLKDPAQQAEERPEHDDHANDDTNNELSHEIPS